MKIFKGRIFSFLKKPDNIHDTGSYILLEKGAIVCDETGVIVEIDDYSKLAKKYEGIETCLLYTSPSPRDLSTSRMPSSA